MSTTSNYSSYQHNITLLLYLSTPTCSVRIQYHVTVYMIWWKFNAPYYVTYHLKSHGNLPLNAITDQKVKVTIEVGNNTNLHCGNIQHRKSNNTVTAQLWSLKLTVRWYSVWLLLCPHLFGSHFSYEMYLMGQAKSAIDGIYASIGTVTEQSTCITISPHRVRLITSQGVMIQCCFFPIQSLSILQISTLLCICISAYFTITPILSHNIFIFIISKKKKKKKKKSSLSMCSVCLSICLFQISLKICWI